MARVIRASSHWLLAAFVALGFAGLIVIPISHPHAQAAPAVPMSTSAPGGLSETGADALYLRLDETNGPLVPADGTFNVTGGMTLTAGPLTLADDDTSATGLVIGSGNLYDVSGHTYLTNSGSSRKILLQDTGTGVADGVQLTGGTGATESALFVNGDSASVTVTGNLLPAADNTYALGATGTEWQAVWTNYVGDSDGAITTNSTYTPAVDGTLSLGVSGGDWGALWVDSIRDGDGTVNVDDSLTIGGALLTAPGGSATPGQPPGIVGSNDLDTGIGFYNIGAAPSTVMKGNGYDVAFFNQSGWGDTNGVYFNTNPVWPSVPAVSFYADTNTGIGPTGTADELGFSTGGTEWANLDATGRLNLYASDGDTAQIYMTTADQMVFNGAVTSYMFNGGGAVDARAGITNGAAPDPLTINDNEGAEITGSFDTENGLLIDGDSLTSGSALVLDAPSTGFTGAHIDFHRAGVSEASIMVNTTSDFEITGDIEPGASNTYELGGGRDWSALHVVQIESKDNTTVEFNDEIVPNADDGQDIGTDALSWGEAHVSGLQMDKYISTSAPTVPSCSVAADEGRLIYYHHQDQAPAGPSYGDLCVCVGDTNGTDTWSWHAVLGTSGNGCP